ncbi:hypothetical protein M8J77_022140 [Diaphorina citri]|nr:hypothetical protein M8J77_022140 [Diaphorina citri]
MSMYSLYRAWLLRDTASIASPSLSLPPDLIINVSVPASPPYQFIAHRTLVATHSGYLKSAIASQEEYGKSGQMPSLGGGLINNTMLNHLNGTPNTGNSLPGAMPSNSYLGNTPQGILEVTLPSSIQVDSFSPLLTFMYTGYLDLNLQNIYELLLAVNILQMPHALDLCRSYLLHNVHSVANLTFNPSARPSLAKPIPGHGGLASLLGGDHPRETSRPVPMDIARPQDVKTTPEEPPRDPSPSPTYTLPTIHPSPGPNRVKGIRNVRRRRFTKPKKPPGPPLRVHSPQSDSSDDVTVVTTELPRACGATEQGGNIVVDVASCDGPVHFTRVLNENYDIYRTRASSPDRDTKTVESARSEDGSEVEINIDENSSDEEGEGGEENEENIARNLETEQSFQLNFRHQIQRQNRSDLTAGDTEPSGGYKCSLCGEEFKTTAQGERHKAAVHHAATRNNQRRVIPRTVLKPVSPTQREVRLLDMNVQYYPCKTCGAKFPSYYFVHKHRRRVHPEEEQGSGGVGVVSTLNQSAGVDTSTAA